MVLGYLLKMYVNERHLYVYGHLKHPVVSPCCMMRDHRALFFRDLYYSSHHTLVVIGYWAGAFGLLIRSL